MSPAGGVGAITAIHDAVTLANWLSTLQYAREKDVEKAFKEYRAERYPAALEAFESSQMFIWNLGKVIKPSNDKHIPDDTFSNSIYLQMNRTCGRRLFGE